MRKLTTKKLVLASHNKGKLREIAALLTPYGISVISAGDLKLTEPKETGSTYIENARIKAHFAAKNANLPALSDDSGFAVACLNNSPGVYSADWAETENGRDFKLAMSKVWAKASKFSAPHKAEFCCTLCLAWPDGHDEIFEGVITGHIQWPPRGNKGFGYDPMFVADGMEKTFAEIDPALKHHISHRAIAFDKFVKNCLNV